MLEKKYNIVVGLSRCIYSLQWKFIVVIGHSSFGHIYAWLCRESQAEERQQRSSVFSRWSRDCLRFSIQSVSIKVWKITHDNSTEM